uniref:Uncharacterized protein n=1 Tax=Vitrella brassicaformis TaxID=1169539 RepID=A0A7S1K3M3_9ALVE|mmetsp:Transcript_34460/g.85389  ORF Transcript_34460/g.85389 Transcript_34460/m.85389 type:complete len:423 (+) Transcript_34460:565-1833(+)
MGYAFILCGTAAVIWPPIDFLLRPLDALPWAQGGIKLLIEGIIKLPVFLLTFVMPFLVVEMVAGLLGEASFIVRAYRQCWVGSDDLGNLLRSVGRWSGLRVVQWIGLIFLECDVALLIIGGICTAWIWSSEEISAQLGEGFSFWPLCILLSVCLGKWCLLTLGELMYVLLLIDGRVGYLLRLLYVIEKGGCWDRCVSLIHYLKHSRLLPSLPIVITAYDLQQVGGRAVSSSRPQAARQYSLFSHRLSDKSARLSRVKGEDHLGGSADSDALTYFSIDLGDPDPPTKRDEYVYSSFTDIIVVLIDRDFVNGFDFRLRPHFTLPDDLIIPPPKEYQLTQDVMRQPRGQWKGCRKADEWSVDGASMEWDGTILILCGDKAADDFLVRVDSSLKICTTEPPVAWKRRPDERYPRTAALIRQKVVAA